MNSISLRIFFRFVGLLLIQVLVLNKLNLFGSLNPMVYVAFVFLHPFKKDRTVFLIQCFLLGLAVDFFSDTGGIHASSLLVIAILRLHALRFFSGKRDLDQQTISIYDISPLGRLYFMAALVLLHHFTLFSLAYFNLGRFLDIIYNTLTTSATSILFIYLGLTIFSRK